MDVQLKELIETIKKEGVQSAEEKAAEIIKKAEQQSSEILEKAQRESERIVARAKEDAERAEQAGRDALRQAGRDLLLNLRASITQIFDALLKGETGEALHGKVLEEAIVSLMQAWNGEDLGQLEVRLPAADLKVLESSLRSRLAEQMKKGLEIKPTADSKAGFLITEKDGNAYYDFSAEGIAEVLSDYLSPRLGELIQSQGPAT